LFLILNPKFIMSTEKITLKIEGMTCGHCEKSVDRIIKEIDGVSECTVSVKNSSAEVTFDNSKTSKQLIIKAVNDSELYKAS